MTFYFFLFFKDDIYLSEGWPSVLPLSLNIWWLAVSANVAV